jgi:hypothetical protein
MLQSMVKKLCPEEFMIKEWNSYKNKNNRFDSSLVLIYQKWSGDHKKKKKKRLLHLLFNKKIIENGILAALLLIL